MIDAMRVRGSCRDIALVHDGSGYLTRIQAAAANATVANITIQKTVLAIWSAGELACSMGLIVSGCGGLGLAACRYMRSHCVWRPRRPGSAPWGASNGPRDPWDSRRERRREIFCSSVARYQSSTPASGGAFRSLLPVRLVPMAGGASGEQRRPSLRVSRQRLRMPYRRHRFHILRHELDVVIAHQAHRHRPHAHAFHVAELHAARARSEFFQFRFHVPRFHPGNIRRANLGDFPIHPPDGKARSSETVPGRASPRWSSPGCIPTDVNPKIRRRDIPNIICRGASFLFSRMFDREWSAKLRMLPARKNEHKRKLRFLRI